MSRRIWGTCADCGEVVECKKSSVGYVTLRHRDQFGDFCEASGCEPEDIDNEDELSGMREETSGTIERSDG